MAANKSNVPARRATPTVSKSKFEALQRMHSNTMKRAREVAEERVGTIVGWGAAGAVGYIEKEGKMPDMGGVEPTLVIGGLLAFGVPMLVRGKLGAYAAEAGSAIGAVAAYKVGRGYPIYQKPKEK
jgi:hypothetical protein